MTTEARRERKVVTVLFADLVGDGVAKIVDERGLSAVRKDLREAFTQVATRFGGLERLQNGRVSKQDAGGLVRQLRQETLFASNALWRALFVALHDAREAGVDPETALDRIKKDQSITWARNDKFFVGSLIDV
jgi:hypothetical protein